MLLGPPRLLPLDTSPGLSGWGFGVPRVLRPAPSSLRRGPTYLPCTPTRLLLERGPPAVTFMIQIWNIAVALRIGLTVTRRPPDEDPDLDEEEAPRHGVKHPTGFQANASTEAQ